MMQLKLTCLCVVIGLFVKSVDPLYRFRSYLCRRMCLLLFVFAVQKNVSSGGLARGHLGLFIESFESTSLILPHHSVDIDVSLLAILLIVIGIVCLVDSC